MIQAHDRRLSGYFDVITDFQRKFPRKSVFNRITNRGMYYDIRTSALAGTQADSPGFIFSPGIQSAAFPTSPVAIFADQARCWGTFDLIQQKRIHLVCRLSYAPRYKSSPPKMTPAPGAGDINLLPGEARDANGGRPSIRRLCEGGIAIMVRRFNFI
jgi:hypothetical protein